MIYFIQSEPGRIKIGHSENVPKRLETIRCSSPYPVRLLLEAPGGRDFELTIHRILEAHRVHMEWFEPHQDVLDVMDEVRTKKLVPADFDSRAGPSERNKRRKLTEAVLLRADELGIAAYGLFQRAGLSPTILNNWRTGACIPSLPTIGKLEDQLALIERQRAA